MRPSIVLGKVFGITIGLHSSWFLIFILITWSLAVGYLPFTYPGWSMGVYWLVGLATSLLFFGSVVAHELSHAVMALRERVPVMSITLFVFGGVAQLGGEPKSPGAEFRITAVGPLASFALAGLFAVVSGAALNPYVTGATLYLAQINLLLAVFNLIPGFPLDGGRILRAILWKIKGDFVRATQWAVMAGKTFAYLLIILGVFAIFSGYFLNGLWLAFIGWFLSTAAEATQQQTVLRDLLRGVTAKDVMTRECEVIPADIHLDQLVNERILGGGRRCFLVLRGGRDEVQGLVTIHNVKEAPRDRWPEMTAAEVMTPVDRLHTARPDEDALELIQKMETSDVNQMPVIEGGRVNGMVTRESLLHYVRTRSELAA
jgi:Zn-dependent protease